MDIEALGDFIVLAQIEPPEKIGSLVMTESKRETLRQQSIGRVLSVGPDVNSERNTTATEPRTLIPINVGDSVMFHPQGAHGEHGLDGNLRIVIRRGNVAGIVKSDQTATAEEVERLKARADKIKQEQESKERAAGLVSPAGALSGIAGRVNGSGAHLN